MSGIKILIFLVCLFHLCFAKFDALDYQLCTEFTFRERTINGFHRFRGAFKINFKDFEEKGGLGSEDFFRYFKANSKKYLELTSRERDKFENRIKIGESDYQRRRILQAATNEYEKFFMKNVTSFINLIYLDIMPPVENFNDMVQLSSGSIQFNEKEILGMIGLAKPLKITGDSSYSKIIFDVFVPVKFEKIDDKKKCTNPALQDEFPLLFKHAHEIRKVSRTSLLAVFLKYNFYSF